MSDYKILEAEEKSELEGEVWNLMQQGWKPLGGVSTTPWGNFIQAMVC
jgi:hypothetical protein